MFHLCEIRRDLSLPYVRTFGLAKRFVMCEQASMDKPTVTELSGRAGISKSYACEILGDRVPPRNLAIHIFRAVGWRHPSIEKLTDDQMAVFEQVEPWVPVAERA